jgi:pimeloyl-ACP methyl ester carboxylesterase
MRVLATMSLCLSFGIFACPGIAQAKAQPGQTLSQEVRLPHISVRWIGRGSPVVLLPGASTPREVWNGVVPELAKRHLVVLVQVNGFAGDDPGANRSTGVLKGAVADLHGYIARTRLSPVALVGHSVGGLMGLMMAADYPRDVSKLMIVDTIPFAGAVFSEKATADDMRPTAEKLRTTLAEGYSGAQGASLAKSMAKSLTAKPASAATVETWILKANPQVAAEALQEDLTTDLRGKIGSVAVAMTLVHPATAFGKDVHSTDAFYRMQFASAKSINFVAIPDAGHFIMLDQPSAFRAALADFLRSNGRAKGHADATSRNP